MDRIRKFALWYLLVVGLIAVGYLLRENKAWPYSFIRSIEKSFSDRAVREWQYGEQALRIARNIPKIQTKPKNVKYLRQNKLNMAVTGSVDLDRRGIYLVNSKGKITKAWWANTQDILDRIPKDFELTNDDYHRIARRATHGSHVFADGSVVLNYPGVLVKLDRCSKIEWIVPGGHHSVHLTPRNTLWVGLRNTHKKRLPTLARPLEDHYLAEVDLNGQVLRKLSLSKVMLKNELHATWLGSARSGRRNLSKDVFHLNDIEELTPQMAAAFPQFTPGDIIISLRHLNLVFVVDPKTEKVKWSQLGPWVYQHDPDFQPDGTITVFDNNTGFAKKGSRIIQIDPVTRDFKTIFQAKWFYTKSRGKHTLRPDGTLIAIESNSGRIIGVDKNGKIVLEYTRGVKKPIKGSLIITGAQIIPDDYFNADLTCPGEPPVR